MSSYRISRQPTRKFRKKGIKTKEIKRLPKGGKAGVFSSHEERLFFVLYYLTTYPTFDVLGFHFGLSAGLDQLPEVTLETPEDLSQLVDQYNDIIIDGVEMACVRPHDEAHQKERYSGKKHR